MIKTAKNLLELLQLLDTQGHNLEDVTIEIGGDISKPLGCICLDADILTLVREGE